MSNTKSNGTNAQKNSKPTVPPILQNYLEHHMPWHEVRENLWNALRSYTLMALVMERATPEDDLEEFLPTYRERIEDIDFLFDLLRHT